MLAGAVPGAAPTCAPPRREARRRVRRGSPRAPRPAAPRAAASVAARAAASVAARGGAVAPASRTPGRGAGRLCSQLMRDADGRDLRGRASETPALLGRRVWRGRARAALRERAAPAAKRHRAALQVSLGANGSKGAGHLSVKSTHTELLCQLVGVGRRLTVRGRGAGRGEATDCTVAQRAASRRGTVEREGRGEADRDLVQSPASASRVSCEQSAQNLASCSLPRDRLGV